MIFSIIRFVYKMSENGLVIISQADFFKCLVLSDQQRKPQRYSLYYHVRQSKSDPWNQQFFA